MSETSIVDTHVHTSKLGPGKLEHLLHLLLLPHVTPLSNQFTTLRGQLLRQRLNERERAQRKWAELINSNFYLDLGYVSGASDHC